jgi:hypothetical protein
MTQSKKPDDPHVSRREFLRRGGRGLLGTILGGLSAFQAGCQQAPTRAPSSEPQTHARVTGRTTVVVIRDERALTASPDERERVIREMLDTALLRVTGLRSAPEAWGTCARKGDKIAMKSNLMMRPVHLELLYAVHSGLMSAGVSDADIAAWDRNSAGFGRAEFAALPRRPGFDGDSVSKLVTDWASGLINITGLKAHWLAGIGCALKNWAGSVTDINVEDKNVAYAFHADSCAEVGKLNAIPAIRERCRLVIVDALEPLFHGGPQVDPQYLWAYKGLIVGTDPVAVDTICARIIQAKRNDYKGYRWPISPPANHIEVADTKYGLGISDPARIDLVKLGLQEGVLV